MAPKATFAAQNAIALSHFCTSSSTMEIAAQMVAGRQRNAVNKTKPPRGRSKTLLNGSQILAQAPPQPLHTLSHAWPQPLHEPSHALKM